MSLVAFGHKHAIPGLEKNLDEWNEYVNHLCDTLKKEPDILGLTEFEGRSMVTYEYKLASTLQTELFSRTSKLINFSFLFALEQSTIGFYNRSAFAMALHILEHHIKSGDFKINIVA